MTVINSSPSILLHAVLPGGLKALPSIIGSIIVPLEVGQELAAGHAIDDTWQALQGAAGFIFRTSAVSINPLLHAQLDLGEAAVIQTALDERHDTVILDDLKARRVAATLSLRVTGTLGILVQAKLAGRLPSVHDAIVALEKRGMWIAQDVAARAIQLAGESP